MSSHRTAETGTTGTGWPHEWWRPALAPHERDSAGAPARPSWTGIVEEAVGTDPGPSAHGGPVAALVAWGCARVADGTGHRFVNRDTVTARFGEQLAARCHEIATRTLTHEFGDAADGVVVLDRAGSIALCTSYPVLARLLGEAARLAVDAHLELLARFAADRPAIVDTLLGATDPGPVCRVEARWGDPHGGGRSVSVVEFSDGRRTVYRPRDVTSHVRFAEMVDRLTDAVPGAALRIPAVVAGDGYGWLEFVEERPLEERGDDRRFSFRLGVLLALLHAVRAVDMHHQNILTVGDQPVLVDVETICHPALPDPFAVDPASRVLRSSVYRTGLLPQFVVEATGISDDSGVSRASVRRAAAGHPAEFVAGFRGGYDAIMRDRQEFAALARRCGDVETRVVVRPTRQYVELLAATCRPDLLRDAGDRDRALVRGLTGDQFDGALVPHELADLWAGDVPLFHARPASRDVVTSNGHRLPGLFERTGLDDVLTTLTAMGVVDRRDQEWIIAASLASGPATGHHDTARVPGPVTGTAADPQQLLTAACAIADQIVSRSMTDRGRVNWLELELVDERLWLVLPMGAGLATGHLGVALFLAQLGEISGIARYREIAQDALTAVPALFDVLAAQPMALEAIGCGGLHGLGGIAFGLARLATLQADAGLHAMATRAVELAASAVELDEAPGPLDWATGTAGCLAAMTAVHAELGLPAAARLAGHCADRLADQLVAGAVPVATGFADGAAGIAWALTTCTARLPGGATNRHLRALEAVTRSPQRVGRTPTNQLGWCTGLAGLVLGGAQADAGALTGALADRELLRDLSLCHGELGIADVAVAITDDKTAVRRYTGQLLDAFNQYGPGCGTPEGVPTPGLLTGLAGIGYGLLRLGFGNQVPSALLLGTTVPGQEGT